MSNFVLVTSDKGPFYINFDKVVSIAPLIGKPEYTMIHLEDGQKLQVHERAVDIFTKNDI